ncbi:uncharacterized protein LOC114294967 isoform X2 [Camellia sinensis]|uniref:uncharacterized protein LOC114294967 isoform X2 n=1 Tax=Camellia sinensis TaxID=4442 RepID=UPI00103687B4|nr:uncharacterized protein LOC114294967 isoform X2 [Camellia sinensis]
MGSLMEGWDSQVPDPRTAEIQRNQSLTNEGIEAYWRSKKKVEEEHLRAIADLLMKSSQESIITESERKRSSSLPLPNTKESQLEMETDQTNLEKLINKNGWWTRSGSAFLNEPPVIAAESPANKYASRYHVAAGIATSKPSSITGISS